MNTATRKMPKAKKNLVEKMVGFYGSIEAAREAYKPLRDKARENKKSLRGHDNCIMVASNGQMYLEDYCTLVWIEQMNVIPS